MPWVRAREICPEHGAVLAVRKTWPALAYWAFFIVTLGQESADFPFRCPKCGRLTTPPVNSRLTR